MGAIPIKNNIGGFQQNGPIPLGQQRSSGAISLGSQNRNPISLGQPKPNPIPLGTNPGIPLAQGNPQSNALSPGQFGGSTQPVKPPNPYGEVAKPTKVKDIQGNSYAPAKPNPNILAQQKQLNKDFQAGLAEDGLIGPKTREAIARYATQSGTTTSSTTPTPTPTPTTPPPPTTPQVGTTTENAQTVLNTGNITPLEEQSRDAVTQAGQATPLELQYIDQVQQAKGMTTAGQLGQFVGSQGYVDKINKNPNEAPGQIYDELINSYDLAGRRGANVGQYNALANAFGSQATQGLLAANTIAGRGQTAANTNLSAAQTQAGRAQGTAGTVFGASLNTPTTPGQATFNPLTGYQAGSVNGSGVNINQFGDPNDPATQANYQSYIKAVGDNNLIGIASTSFNSNFDKAIADAQQVNSILTPEQKNTPIEKLIQLITNGVLGTSPVLSGLVNDITAIKNSYKQATGNDLIIPPTATLDQLSTIRSSAQSAIKAAQAGNQQLIDKYSSGSNKPSGGTTGDFSWDFLAGL